MTGKCRHPEFSMRRIPLTACSACGGRAVISGLFGPRPCIACNVSGWVSAATGEQLPLEDLAMQLGLRLRELEQQAESKPLAAISGPEDQYQSNNRRGAGGTNYTGD